MEINCDITYALGKAIEHGPFLVALPIKDSDSPVRKLLVCQRVISFNSITLLWMGETLFFYWEIYNHGINHQLVQDFDPQYHSIMAKFHYINYIYHVHPIYNPYQ